MADENKNQGDESWADSIEVKDNPDAYEDNKNRSSSADSSGKILNQDEIDSLLGFSDDEDSGEITGLKAILDSSMISYERLPMLEIIFDRLVRLVATSMRNLTQDNVEISLETIESMRFGEYLNSITLPTLLAVFKAEEWDNFGLMSIDSSLAYSVVDVLLGGRRGTAAMRIEGRPYTTIERGLIKKMIKIVLADLSSAFDPVSPVTFRYDRLETNPRFAAISRHSNAVIVARLRIDMEDRGGRLDLMIPYATLEPVRELLLQMFMGEKFGRDTIWETHLVEELWDTSINLHAVLDEQIMNLKEVSSWEVGSQIMLDAVPSSEIKVMCGDVPLLSGHMGRKGNNIAIRVKNKHKRKG